MLFLSPLQKLLLSPVALLLSGALLLVSIMVIWRAHPRRVSGIWYNFFWISFFLFLALMLYMLSMLLQSALLKVLVSLVAILLPVTLLVVSIIVIRRAHPHRASVIWYNFVSGSFSCLLVALHVIIIPLAELLIPVALLVVSILVIRRAHPHHVSTIWYIFFLTSFCFLVLLAYLYDIHVLPDSITLSLRGDDVPVWDLWSPELAMYPNGDNNMPLWVKLLYQLMRALMDFQGEIYFLSIVLMLVIVPQTLSFIVSGIFGCGSRPILVSTTTRFAILSLIKFFCVLAGIFNAHLMFWTYIGNADVHYLTSMAFVGVVHISISFTISAMYYAMDSVWQHIIDRSQNKSLNAALSYMTRYPSNKGAQMDTTR